MTILNEEALEKWQVRNAVFGICDGSFSRYILKEAYLGE